MNDDSTPKPSPQNDPLRQAAVRLAGRLLAEPALRDQFAEAKASNDPSAVAKLIETTTGITVEGTPQTLQIVAAHLRVTHEANVGASPQFFNVLANNIWDEGHPPEENV